MYDECFLVSVLCISVECAGLLKKYKGKPTLVFCNKSETCYWLSNSLKALGVENLLLTGYDEYKVSPGPEVITLTFSPPIMTFVIS